MERPLIAMDHLMPMQVLQQSKALPASLALVRPGQRALLVRLHVDLQLFVIFKQFRAGLALELVLDLVGFQVLL